MASHSASQRRVFVTGARGFLGAHLAAALCGAGMQVTALVRSAGTVPGGIREVVGDLRDAAGLAALLAAESYDTIFHLAGLNAAAGATALYEANVVGTASLLQAVRALNRPNRRVVLVGSSAEYGASPDDPLTEDSAVMPVGDYGISKLAATRMGQVLHATSGQHVVLVRPFNVIGPGFCPTLLHAEVARQVVEIESGNRPPQIRLRALSSYRDFVDVRDVANGLMGLAEAGAAGQIYNLCSGQAVQAAILVDQLLAMAHLPITLYTEQSSPGLVDVPYQRGSFEKVKKTSGWAPCVSLEKTLTDTLNYWRKQANMGDFSGPVSGALQK